MWLNPTALIAGTGSSLDPGAFGFPAVNSNFQTGYDWPVIALTGLLDSSFSNYNITKEGNALPNGTPALRHFRTHEFETYAQDSWRVTPQLTLTYGVRYTLLQPPYETTGTQVAPSISLESFLQNRAAAMLARTTGQILPSVMSFPAKRTASRLIGTGTMETLRLDLHLRGRQKPTAAWDDACLARAGRVRSVEVTESITITLARG